MKDMGMREYMLYDAQKKSGALAFVLCFFFGMTGAHRFYTGRFLTGGLQLLLFLVGIASTWLLVGYVPLALVGLWVIVDCFLVLGWVRKHNVALLNRLERVDQPADDVDAVGTLEPVAESPVPGSGNQSGKRLAVATIGVVALVALAAIGDHEFPQISLPWLGHHVSTDHGSVSVQEGNIVYTDASRATLAMTESGDTDVTAENSPASAPAGSRFAVQLGTFDDDEVALEWVSKLKAVGVPAYVEHRKQDDGSDQVLLRAGPFKDRASAAKAIAKVHQAGFGNPEQVSATGHAAPGYSINVDLKDSPCEALTVAPTEFIALLPQIAASHQVVLTVFTTHHKEADGTVYAVLARDNSGNATLYTLTDTLAACASARRTLRAQ